MSCLCDSGANVSIVSSKIIESWEEKSKPEIVPVKILLCTVTGENKPFLGKALMNINLGGHNFQHEMLISDIVQDAILGIDFMRSNKCDLIISKNYMSVKGDKIPCYMKTNSSNCCRVAIAENIVIEPNSEVVISGKILDHTDKDRSCLIEGFDTFTEKTGLMVAKVVVDAKTGSVPVRIANFSETPVTLYKDTVTATLEPVEIVKNENIGSTEVQTGNVNTSRLPDHLSEMFEKSSVNLNSAEAEDLRKFLIKHQNIFSKGPGDIGHTTLVKHTIETRDAKPVKKYPYRIPLSKRKVVEDEISKMEKEGIIEKCPQSPWNAPVVTIVKPDGSIRFCCDYRGLNEVTVKDSQPLPRIDDSIEALSGSKWWSCLDLSSAYWQCEIDENDRNKTAFSIPGGQQWQWKRLAFGLCNAPATFTRLMQMVFSGLLWKIVIIYLDDIICSSKTFQEQLDNLEIVFKRLTEANLKLNPKKCVLFQKQVIFLGHVINENGVGTDPQKIDKIRSWPTPRNAKEARSFISLASYYRTYIYQFATIAKPLHELSEKSRQFIWSTECEQSFQAIKKALTNAPILSFPTENDQFILDTDASLVGQGAVLSQVINGKEKVIGYYSKCFTKTERRYCVTRRELLAIVNAVKHFHHYVYGRNVIIRSDHSSLKWLLNFKNVEGQLARWLTFLSAYDFTIQHRAGRLHSNADALSRRPCLESNCRYCSRVESKETEISIASVEVLPFKGEKCDKIEKEDTIFISLALLFLVIMFTVNTNFSLGMLLMILVLKFENFVQYFSEIMSIIEDFWEWRKCSKNYSEVTKGVNSSSGRNPELLVENFSSLNPKYMDDISEKDRVTTNKACSNTIEKQDNVVINAVETENAESNSNFRENETSQLNIAELQDKDFTLKLVKDLISNGIKPEWQEISKYGTEVKYYWARLDSMVLKNNTLYRKWETDDGSSSRLLLVIPQSEKELILKQLHDGKTGAHLGIKKTLHKVRERYFWYALRKDVENWCKLCDICNSRRNSLRKSKAPLQTYNVGAPNERIAIDFMGPFVKTNKGNKYLMVVGDLFSKWTECFSIPNLEATTVADILVNQYISRWGCPLICHTDQGKTFESKLFVEMCRLLGIEKTRSSICHPQGNGFIERQNSTIIKMLNPYVSKNQKDWDEHVDLVMLAYRSSVQASTGFTPTMLHIGREVRLPVDIVFGTPELLDSETEKDKTSYTINLEKKLLKVHEIVRQNMEIASQSMKVNYNVNVKYNIFKEGDLVWYYCPVRKKGLSPKFQKPWIGPCKVVNKVNDVLYRIKISSRQQSKVVHHNKLKPYIGREKVHMTQ